MSESNPRITYGSFYTMLVEGDCPDCGETCGTDCSGLRLDEISENVVFNCEEHGDFTSDLNWCELIQKFLKKSNPASDEPFVP